MNTYLVTDLVDIYDATEDEDEFGDPTDDGALIDINVHMSLLERSDVTKRPQDDEESSVRIYAGICPNGTDIAAGYRLHSTTSDSWYLVDHIRTTEGPLQMPIRLHLRRVDQ